MKDAITQSSARSYLANKVPEVTLIFWLIKMMSTTVGETGADLLTFKLHWGLVNTTIVLGVLFLGVLYKQMQANRYIPWLYWLTVVLVSVFGTLITDNLTDKMHVPLALSTGVFGGLLILTFWFWYNSENTLSIREIDTFRREAFYWGAVLTTFALGTAAGDWVSEGLRLGYAVSAIWFGGAIAAVAVAHYFFRLSSVTSFWIAYVLTRPLGASCGDLMAKSAKHGGLGLGTVPTSIIFLGVIVALIVYLTHIANRRQVLL